MRHAGIQHSRRGSSVWAWLVGVVATLVLLPGWAQEYTGVVHPLRDLTLSLGVGGVIAEVPVKAGQQVKQGQTLLVLQDRLQRIEAQRRKLIWEDHSELDAVSERLKILEALYKEDQVLYQQAGSISRDDLDKLRLELIAARGRDQQLKAEKGRQKLEYEAAQQEREMRRLSAPVAGTVTWSEMDVGEWAKPGEPLLRLVDDSTCVLRVSVPEAAVATLKPGTALPVYAGSERLDGEVTFIAPVADAASGLVEVKVSFANPRKRVRSGIKASIRLDHQQ